MSDVIGKTCPYCQNPIKPGESVVFCSACSIPHHQECWNEGMGCTTFGCNGHPTEPSNRYGQNNSAAIDIDFNTDTKRCSNCGLAMSNQAVYCSRCGTRIVDIAAAGNSHTPQITATSSQYNAGVDRQTGTRHHNSRLNIITIVLIVLLVLTFTAIYVIYYYSEHQTAMDYGDKENEYQENEVVNEPKNFTEKDLNDDELLKAGKVVANAFSDNSDEKMLINSYEINTIDGVFYLILRPKPPPNFCADILTVILKRDKENWSFFNFYDGSGNTEIVEPARYTKLSKSMIIDSKRDNVYFVEDLLPTYGDISSIEYEIDRISQELNDLLKVEAYIQQKLSDNVYVMNCVSSRYSGLALLTTEDFEFASTGIAIFNCIYQGTDVLLLSNGFTKTVNVYKLASDDYVNGCRTKLSNLEIEKEQLEAKWNKYNL